MPVKTQLCGGNIGAASSIARRRCVASPGAPPPQLSDASLITTGLSTLNRSSSCTAAVTACAEERSEGKKASRLFHIHVATSRAQRNVSSSCPSEAVATTWTPLKQHVPHVNHTCAVVQHTVFSIHQSPDSRILDVGEVKAVKYRYVDQTV